MATLSDIARKAGVGMSTASYVINKTGLNKVSPETRARILAAARELHYVPNVAGRALAKGLTFMAGVLFPDLGGTFILEILGGLEDTLNEAGYSMIFARYHDEEEFYAKCRFLAAKQIDGAIILPIHQVKKIRSDLMNLKSARPLVSLAKDLRSHGIPSVYVDGEKINYLAVKHLLENGHRRIAVQKSHDTARLDGARLAAAEYPDASLLISPMTPGSGADFLKWGLSHRNPPTGYVTYGDNPAAELISAALDLGLSIPDDISVIGVNGDSIGRLTRPLLTTVNQPKWEQGAMAAKLLLRQISRKPVENVILQPDLIQRNTVKSLNKK